MSLVINRKMVYINLGCGNRHHPAWKNFDFESSHPDVVACDLRSGIPLADETADVVYHSHVLEHFVKDDAIFFLHECKRILKPGGILRVAVPDLEQIVRSYLTCLEAAREGTGPSAEANYEWAVIELIDQMCRNRSGGEMLNYWKQDEIVNEPFIMDRVGSEYGSFRKRLRASAPETSTGNGKMKQDSPMPVLHRLRRKLGHLLWPDQGALSPEQRVQLTVGKFRLSGEVHQWMYDEFSLERLLLSSGFKAPGRKTAFESEIPNWADFIFLDVEGGLTRKPDSLFMEARK
jgi:predicted SAM-dependent methyltransferase